MMRMLVAALTALAFGACAQTAGPAAPAPPPLNHVFVVVDDATYDAIAASDAVAGFAAHRAVATQSDGDRWSGFYLFGAETYVELFRPGGRELDGRTIGLAFGYDDAGRLEAWGASAAVANLQWDRRTRNMPDGRSVPWFDRAIFDPSDAEAETRAWVMEYRPEFFVARDGADGEADVSRRAYLRRIFDPDKRLIGIVGLEISAPSHDVARLEDVLSALGYRIDRGGASGFDARGPDGLRISVREREMDAASRLTIDLRSKPGEPIALAFGPDSRLQIDQTGEGRWTFETVDRRSVSAER